LDYKNAFKNFQSKSISNKINKKIQRLCNEMFSEKKNYEEKKIKFLCPLSNFKPKV
jgi:hypothetical protein